MAKRRKRVGELLMEWGVINDAQLAEGLKHANTTDKRIGEALVELEFAEEDDVTKALAVQFDMEYVDLTQNVIVPGALDLLPRDLIAKQLVLPLSRENGRIKIIITDPLDLETLDLIRFRLNCDVECAIASRSKVQRFLDTFLRPEGESIDQTIHELSQDGTTDAGQSSKLDAELADADDAEAPIIRMVSLLITEAVNSRASDIHIEPMSNRVRVRYRIDGVCLERDSIPKRMQGSVISRLKIMAGIDIAEKRLPQDGRIKMTVGGAQIDFRVSACPAYHGESMVLRILRPESVRIGIEALGFEHDDNQRFERIIHRPNGIFLVTGPTGSGKTTTLYGALNELNRPDRKIITAEDPVEYNFSGINQCQVREGIGLTFPTILRSMLRQAPNIILVGEIRDLDVAEVAIQAALTGHLVFSTLHTNDAPSAITRLIDMGVKPFLVASSIQAVMAQRLIRKICPNCKDVDPAPDDFLLRQLGIDRAQLKDRPIYQGKGCKNCNGSGYRGRQGIFEMMVMNNELRELAFKRSPVNLIRKAARASGMRNLVEDGVLKILNGITTPDEIVRSAQVEGVLAEV